MTWFDSCLRDISACFCRDSQHGGALHLSAWDVKTGMVRHPARRTLVELLSLLVPMYAGMMLLCLLSSSQVSQVYRHYRADGMLPICCVHTCCRGHDHVH